MELSQFRDHPITELFTDGGQSVEITLNANAFTPDFLRMAAKEIRRLAGAPKPTAAGKKGKKESTPNSAETVAQSMESMADSSEIQREVYAKMLSSNVLRSWGVTDGGQPVDPTYKNLVTLHPRTVIGLWFWCMDKASPKEHETLPTGTSPMTQETTSDGSLRVENSVENQTM